MYYPVRDNPHLKECPDATFLNNHIGDEPEFATDAQGRFRAIALPGPGLLTVRASEPGYTAAQPLATDVAGNVLYAANFQFEMRKYHALVPINPGKEGTTVVPDIVITAGKTQRIRVVGQDGRPIAGTRVFGPLKGSLAGEVISSAEFTIVHPKPGTAESMLVVREDQSEGCLLQIKGNEPDPISVKLQPTATITGRLVDENGRPRAGLPLAVTQDLGNARFDRFTDRAPTDADGRFRLRGLVPGVSYTLEILKNNEKNFSDRALGYLRKTRWTVKPGETQDWGDVQIQEYKR